MLVLSRKVGETVVIGGNIQVTVTRVAGNRVTLGISAPSAVRVVRGELGAPQASSGHEPLEQGKEPANGRDITSESAKVARDAGKAPAAPRIASSSTDSASAAVASAAVASAAAIQAASRSGGASGDAPMPVLTTVG